MEEKKNKLYLKWWCWLILVALLILIIYYVVYTATNQTILTNTNLDTQITIGKLTYYIENNWEHKENVDGNSTYEYYYPTNNTMLMIMVSTNDTYGNNSTISSFMDAYISGMNLSNDDFISKSTKTINNYNYGIVKYYTYSNNYDKYEVISYVMPNNNECYVFSFGQKNKLNNQNIDLVENIISKAEIIQETKEEKQARIEEEQKEAEKKARKEQEEKERKQKEEAEAKAKREQEEKDFKASCKIYTYEQIARNPENFKGTNVKLTGEVIQVMVDSYSTNLRVNITKKGSYSTYYTDTVYIVYHPEAGEDKILENDIITIYGTSQGDCSYTTIMGATVTLPNILAKYITINK